MIIDTDNSEIFYKTVAEFLQNKFDSKIILTMPFEY